MPKKKRGGQTKFDVKKSEQLKLRLTPAQKELWRAAGQYTGGSVTYLLDGIMDPVSADILRLKKGEITPAEFRDRVANTVYQVTMGEQAKSE